MANSCLDKLLGKRRRTKAKVSALLEPNSAEHFLYFRAIQGDSGGTLVDLTLQDNVLLPDDFAEYVHHVGNAHDMHSIIQCGLILGGKKSQEGKAVRVLHSREPHQNKEEVQYDLDKP